MGQHILLWSPLKYYTTMSVHKKIGCPICPVSGLELILYPAQTGLIHPSVHPSVLPSVRLWHACRLGIEREMTQAQQIRSIFFKRGWLYATRVKSYNPLLWMVARIRSYKIVHVGDFLLSHLRLYLCFFRTFIYGFLHTWGLGGNLHFFRLKYFLLFNPTLLYEFT
jgi:hypothetical protein